MLQGFAQACKSPISRPVSFLCLALRCTVLCSQWCQSGVNSYRHWRWTLRSAHVVALPVSSRTPQAAMHSAPTVCVPLIAVASGGPASARIAAELGDAIFVTEPRTDITDAYAEAGGNGPRYAEVPLSWAPDEEEGRLRNARDGNARLPKEQ